MKSSWFDLLRGARGDSVPSSHPLHRLYIEDVKFLIYVAAAQFALLAAYKLIHGSSWFGASLLSRIPWEAFTPYLRYADEPISESVRVSVGLYYLLAALIFAVCIARFFVRRTAKLKMKKLLLLTAVIGFFTWSWAVGADFRRTSLAGFHRGEVGHHFGHMLVLMAAIAIGCIEVFRGKVGDRLVENASS
jgi:hypothetical protein